MRLSLQSFGDAVPQAVLDGFERRKRRRVVAPGLLQHLLTRHPEHQHPAERVAVEHPADEAAGALPAGPPAARELLRRRQGDVAEDGGRHELVHDPELERFPGALDLPGEDDVERGTGADQPRQPLAAAGARQEAKLHLGQTELGLGVVGRDAVGAGEREFEPAAQTRAVNPHDHRLGERRDPAQHLVAIGREAFGFGRRGELDELLDVRAGDEVVGLARKERDRLGTGLGREPLERRVELVLHRPRDDVDGVVGEIERDDRDAILQFASEGRHHRRSRTIAKAMPPCAQMEMRPSCTSRRRISLANVVTMRPPVAPNGWPMAIEPPITLIRSSSISQPFSAQPVKLDSTCAANASCTSISPRSCQAMPARSSAFGTAQTGACSSCHPGSTAATA